MLDTYQSIVVHRKRDLQCEEKRGKAAFTCKVENQMNYSEILGHQQATALSETFGLIIQIIVLLWPSSMPDPKKSCDPCHLLLETHLLLESSGGKKWPMSSPQQVPYNFSDHNRSALMRLTEGGAPSRNICHHPELQLRTYRSRVLEVCFFLFLSSVFPSQLLS